MLNQIQCKYFPTAFMPDFGLGEHRLQAWVGNRYCSEYPKAFFARPCIVDGGKAIDVDSHGSRPLL
ncbi:hypothetical protein D3C80_2053160 [compost metagenome]